MSANLAIRMRCLHHAGGHDAQPAQQPFSLARSSMGHRGLSMSMHDSYDSGDAGVGTGAAAGASLVTQIWSIHLG